jgi:alpha-amylase
MHHLPNNVGSNCAIDNYKDIHEVQYCDLDGLPDLCTGCAKVQKQVQNYINTMAEIGVAGMRIDAAKHQNVSELGELLSGINASFYRFQEVITGNGEAVRPDMYYQLGQVTEFGFQVNVGSAFAKGGDLGSLQALTKSSLYGTPMMPSDYAVVFLDNHDSQRPDPQQTSQLIANLTYKDGSLYELATVFMLAYPYGYPKVMSSYAFETHDQGPPSTPVYGPASSVNCASPPSARGGLKLRGDTSPWVCEHRWPPIANMVGWRKVAGNASLTDWQTISGNVISFCRGEVACIVLNRQQEQWTGKVTWGIKPGNYCDVIHSSQGTCSKVEVASGGFAQLTLPAMSAVAVHVGRVAPAVVENLISV